MTTDLDYKQQKDFIKKHSDLKVGQVVNAFIGKYKKIKTKVTIKHTPICKNNEMTSRKHPIYWVQILDGNPHLKPVFREDIVW